MDTRESADMDAAGRLLERECEKVDAAIALVRSGAAAVVSITGLRFGEAVLRRVRTTRADQGVALEPRWWPDDEGCDIVVRATRG